MDWRNYIKNSKDNADLVAKVKPDIVQKVREIFRQKKEGVRRKNQKGKEDESRRKAKVLEDGGEWVFNPEYSE